MKYLAAKLAVIQQARAHGKIRTMKIDESLHPTAILTKPLQGREFVYKRARVFGLEEGVPPPTKGQTEGAKGPDAAAQQPAKPSRATAARQQKETTPAGAGIAARYEQLALRFAPWRERRTPGQAGRFERGTWGRALSLAGLTA